MSPGCNLFEQGMPFAKVQAHSQSAVLDMDCPVPQTSDVSYLPLFNKLENHSRAGFCLPEYL